MPKRKMENEDDASEPSTSNNVECSRKVTDDNDRNYNRVQPGHSTPEQKESTDLDLVSVNQHHEDTPDRSTTMIREGLIKTSYDVDGPCLTTLKEEFQNSQGILPSMVATMPVARTDECYKMNYPNRGICLVLNHESFDANLPEREGTELDVMRIHETFTKLRFNVVVLNDPTCDQVSNAIKKLSDPNTTEHHNSDCICVFVLTHGRKNHLIMAKDREYVTGDLWKPFTGGRCRTLAGKPKLFFIQADNGKDLDAAVTLNLHCDNTEADSPIPPYTIPTYSDFLIADSCADGFRSHLDPNKGSWYIQCLCDVLDSYADSTDLMTMLTMTAQRVSTDCTWNGGENSQTVNRKQVPSIMSTLTRDIYFFNQKDRELRKVGACSKQDNCSIGA